MPPLEVADLGREDLALAWPLVRLNMPDLQLANWEAFACDILDRGGGVIAVTAPSKSLQGIATYEPVSKPHFGRILHVSLLVSFELSGRSPVRRLLMTALNLRSHAIGCSEVVISSHKRPRSRSASVALVQ